MKRQGKGRAARARPKRSRSPKTNEILGLVEAISADFGTGNGVHLGRGIADLLADMYRERRVRVPTWVKELIAHYGDRHRGS